MILPKRFDYRTRNEGLALFTLPPYKPSFKPYNRRFKGWIQGSLFKYGFSIGFIATIDFDESIFDLSFSYGTYDRNKDYDDGDMCESNTN